MEEEEEEEEENCKKPELHDFTLLKRAKDCTRLAENMDSLLKESSGEE